MPYENLVRLIVRKRSNRGKRKLRQGFVFLIFLRPLLSILQGAQSPERVEVCKALYTRWEKGLFFASAFISQLADMYRFNQNKPSGA